MTNSHLLQKYGFTVRENPNAKVTFIPQMAIDQMFLNQEKELKDKLYERKEIPRMDDIFYFYEKKFDANILASLRIAFLTTDMVNSMTFDHIWNHETFKSPLSSTQEEIVLNAIYNHIFETYRAIKDKDYDFLRDQIEFDSVHNVNLYNIYNIERDEQLIMKNNLAFIQRKLDDLHHQRLMEKRQQLR